MVPSLIVVAHLVSFLYDLGIDFVEKELLCLDLPFANYFLRMKSFGSFHFFCYFGELVLILILKYAFL